MRADLHQPPEKTCASRGLDRRAGTVAPFRIDRSDSMVLANLGALIRGLWGASRTAMHVETDISAGWGRHATPPPRTPRPRRVDA